MTVHGSKSTDDELKRWVNELVAQAQARKFYGELVVELEGGRIKRVVSKQSLLPPGDSKT